MDLFKYMLHIYKYNPHIVITNQELDHPLDGSSWQVLSHEVKISPWLLNNPGAFPKCSHPQNHPCYSDFPWNKPSSYWGYRDSMDWFSWENLQETIDFFPLDMGFSCKFSLKPIHWAMETPIEILWFPLGKSLGTQQSHGVGLQLRARQQILWTCEVATWPDSNGEQRGDPGSGVPSGD